MAAPPIPLISHHRKLRDIKQTSVRVVVRSPGTQTQRI
jgi:hypothetical protein